MKSDHKSTFTIVVLLLGIVAKEEHKRNAYSNSTKSYWLSFSSMPVSKSKFYTKMPETNNETCPKTSPFHQTSPTLSRASMLLGMIMVIPATTIHTETWLCAVLLGMNVVIATTTMHAEAWPCTVFLGVIMIVSTTAMNMEGWLYIVFFSMIVVVSAATMDMEGWVFLRVIMIVSATAVDLEGWVFLGVVMIISAATVASKLRILIIERERHVDESALVVGTLSIIRHHNAGVADGILSPVGGGQGVNAEEP